MKMKHVLMLLGSYDQSAHEGIAQYAGQHGWHLNVGALKDFKLPEHWKGDGIIASLNGSVPLEEFILKADVPVVDLSIWREDINLPRVVADNAAIGLLGAEHFLGMGHQHCAWFALASNPVSRARYKAYRDRLARAGIDCIRLDAKRPQDAAFITTRLRALPKPCAVYTKSDYDSAWILNVCMDAGLRVPEDVAILGADNNLLICENQSVPLSSVRHDLKKIGYEGAALLDQLMRGEQPEQLLKLIPPRGIEIRQSTDSLAVTDLLIRDSIGYLKSHYRQSISVAEVANALQVSRRKLEVRFKISMHCSVHEFLIQVRIEAAKQLLKFSDRPVEEIAALTGFCHAPHFSNTFKKYSGLSPLKYRNRP